VSLAAGGLLRRGLCRQTARHRELQSHLRLWQGLTLSAAAIRRARRRPLGGAVPASRSVLGRTRPFSRDSAQMGRARAAPSGALEDHPPLNVSWGRVKFTRCSRLIHRVQLAAANLARSWHRAVSSWWPPEGAGRSSLPCLLTPRNLHRVALQSARSDFESEEPHCAATGPGGANHEGGRKQSPLRSTSAHCRRRPPLCPHRPKKTVFRSEPPGFAPDAGRGQGTISGRSSNNCRKDDLLPRL
jgi:hypothetical protein